MTAALIRSETLGYSFGAKLVRGAYVEAERKRWANAGSKGDCLIWDTKAQTDEAYDNCAAILQKRITSELKETSTTNEGRRGTAIFVASHNGTSVKILLDALRKDGLAHNTAEGLEIDDRVRGRMSFAQLMGSCFVLRSRFCTR
jgi:proline dehydrogenase